MTQAVDLAKYSHVTTGTIGHFRTEGFLTWKIQALFRPVQIIGRALTVSCAPMDNSWVGEAVQQTSPGTVLVVERQGDLRHACWGGLMSRSAALRGTAGVVIDGAATDWREINELQFPVFCRHLSSLTTRNQKAEGSIGEPVTCGGISVQTGDIILADDDGVVALPQAEAESILERAVKFELREARFRELMIQGHTPPEIRQILDEEMPRF